MADPYWASQHEECAHKNDFSELWDEIPWKFVEKITLDHSVIDQYNRLKVWESTQSQPVKNVQLMTRVIRPPEWVLWKDREIEVPQINPYPELHDDGVHDGRDF